MEAFKRIIDRLYPELKAGYHLPMLGRVEQISNPEFQGEETITLDEPLYAVDVQPLDRDFKQKGPILKDLIVMMPYGGQQRGFFSLPDPETIIEFCFAYASPKLIFIRGVIPLGLKVPPWRPGASQWHSSAEVWQGYDIDNNWNRHTTESIKESCGQIYQCTAAVKQLLKSPKTWIGSDTENLLTIIADLMSKIEAALSIISSHTHSGGQVGAPDQGGDIAAKSSEIGTIRSGRLSPITE